MGQAMIEVRDLRKTFGAVEAVRGISFRVERGEIVGFLGPNGAGKTTTLRILAGIFPPTSGEVRIAGRDPARDPLACRRAVGYFPEYAPFYPDLRVEGYLRFVARPRRQPDRLLLEPHPLRGGGPLRAGDRRRGRPAGRRGHAARARRARRPPAAGRAPGRRTPGGRGGGAGRAARRRARCARGGRLRARGGGRRRRHARRRRGDGGPGLDDPRAARGDARPGADLPSSGGRRRATAGMTVLALAGKFIACLAVVTLMLAGTAVYPLMLVRFYPVAAGPLVAGYLGLWMLAAAFVACGLFVSALTENQLLAGAATYGVLLFFWVVTWNEAAMNEVTRHLLLPFSLFDRFYTFALGAVDTGNVSYLVLFTVAFLCFTLFALDARRWRGVR